MVFQCEIRVSKTLSVKQFGLSEGRKIEGVDDLTGMMYDVLALHFKC